MKQFIAEQKSNPLKEPLLYRKPDDVIHIDRKMIARLKLIASFEGRTLQDLLKMIHLDFIKSWKEVLNQKESEVTV